MQAFKQPQKKRDKTVTIVGGGLAGLTLAILLNRGGFDVTVVEKKVYPFHRVCGEYISNEVLPLLIKIGIHPSDYGASSIQKLAVSSPSGRIFRTTLDLGGFGLSRFHLDQLMFEQAKREGVQFLLGLKANNIVFSDNNFTTSLSNHSDLISSYVISAHGKRSNLDKHRAFFSKRSPYLGVKYHIKADLPRDLIQLDNFEGGYCGTVKIEQDKYCLCYLTKTDNLKRAGSLEEMEKNILSRNPFLKHCFTEAEFIYDKPEVINEISFAVKSLIEDHVLFCGDSAGMISPLCGNGMAIAIHSAKILADLLCKYHLSPRSRLEQAYKQAWNNEFRRRLQFGRQVQKLFGKNILSEFAVSTLNISPSLAEIIIKKTHGRPF
ncbi:NAD(P)/FAD-dependent oxidoreductase [Pedobacter sp. SYSU D00535]|uniref:NAD(P)/FAD-dependent oxidoreductase n=1 Tax=Pedobacter sp. SYSU D00535 TaxID=2810308 RepID=UPI001A95BE82|nr:NAD(P)/FAD-dependent oxidoreductase [Pedobacter sp. SYSU D00535]